jgi:cathepsin B
MASEEGSLDYSELRQNARKGALKANKKAGSSNTTTYIAVALFGLVVAFVLGLLIFNPELPLNMIPVIDAEYIKGQNELNLGFNLGENDFFKDKSLEYARLVSRSGISNTGKNISPCISYQNEGEIVPAEYDLRVERPECVNEVQDQGNCSSSYAFTTTSVLSERLCMLSAGLHDQRLSAQDMISCARRTKKCESGNLDNAFNHLREEGVVDSECFPYKSSNGEVPECSERCQKLPFKLASVCATAGEGGLMREIKNNGPIAAVMYLYTDFLVYKGGIYEPHISATRLNAIQAVEVLGWGVTDKEVGYWIVKNSWGTTWGDQGYAYIKKGIKDLGLEDYALTGTPVVPEAEKANDAEENFENLDEEFDSTI